MEEGRGGGEERKREEERERGREGEREKGGWSGSKENAGEENERGELLVERASTLVSRLLRGR